SQHTNSGFSSFQFASYAVTIGLAESEVLVVKGAEATANQGGAEPDRGNQRQGDADTGALAHAALADLVGLDLAFLVEDQDADGIPLRRARVLQGRGCHVGRCLIIEIAKTTVLFDIYIPILSCVGQAHSRAEQ